MYGPETYHLHHGGQFFCFGKENITSNLSELIASMILTRL